MSNDNTFTPMMSGLSSISVMSCCILIAAAVVFDNLRYAYWFDPKWSDRVFRYEFTTSLSKTLDTTGSKEIGLNSFGGSIVLFFGIGVTSADFQYMGK